MKKLNIKEVLDKTYELKKKKIGNITIIWRPNVWKSTFLNTLIWEKISIVSNIPQTTRNKILAIYNDNDSQIIFFDTPWIHESNKLFNEAINNEAIKTLNKADVILYFIDSSRKTGEEEVYINNLLEKINKPLIKVFTKKDLINKLKIKKDDIYISSKTKEWFNNLLKNVKKYLKEDIIPYSEDFYTKQNIFFRISEIIREQVFLNTKQELPHSVYIGVEEIEDKKNLLKIVAYIYTETNSQKYIIIGKNGKLILKISTQSRLELEKVFNKKVFLALRVKRREKWRKNKNVIKWLLEIN